MPNRLSGIVDKFNALPRPARQVALSKTIGTMVKFAGTSGLRILEMRSGHVHVRLENKKKIQNHIGGLHAAAMALLAESATGFVVGLAVPDESIPVIKSMKVEYKKRSRGAMEAIATLDEETLHRIATTPKGEVLVPVSVTDETGNEPIQCEMLWAWTPKRRKDSKAAEK
jgi:acyl-coenzyme A thioesterase PaaI-like protein